MLSYIHYKGKEYGDLAANIGSTNRNPSPEAPRGALPPLVQGKEQRLCFAGAAC